MTSSSASTSSPSSSHRQNNFNFIRLVLASLVLLSHGVVLRTGSREAEPLVRVFHSLTLGEVAIIGFFVLSGFLIVQSWVQRPRLGEFLTKRFLRIVPGFAVAFVVSVVVVGALNNNREFFNYLSPTLLLRNLLTLYQPRTPAVFSPQPYPLVNGSMWTITYEVRCYLLVALLGLLGAFSNPRKLVGMLGVGAVLLLALQKSGISSALPEELKAFTGFDFYHLAFCFLCGTFFFIYRERIPLTKVGALIALVCIGIALVLHKGKFSYFGVALPLTYLLFWFAYLQTPWLQKTRLWPDFSYGIYLYAWPIQKITIFYLPQVPTGALIVLQFLLTCVCGAMSWYCIEKPALKWKPKPAASVRSA